MNLRIKICLNYFMTSFILSNSAVVFAEFSKKCAERWKAMNDKEKKRFHDMAEQVILACQRTFSSLPSVPTLVFTDVES